MTTLSSATFWVASWSTMLRLVIPSRLQTKHARSEKVRSVLIGGAPLPPRSRYAKSSKSVSTNHGISWDHCRRFFRHCCREQEGIHWKRTPCWHDLLNDIDIQHLTERAIRPVQEQNNIHVGRMMNIPTYGRSPQSETSNARPQTVSAAFFRSRRRYFSGDKTRESSR